MKPNEVEQFLKQSMDDYRLSRGERRVLKETLETTKADEHQRAVLLAKVFDIARQGTVDPETAAVLDWVEDVVKVLARGPKETSTQQPDSYVYFSPEDDCAAKIRRLLDNCRKSADVCVFTITDNVIAEGILGVHRRGIPLRIITDNEKAEDRGSDIFRLQEAGIPVRVDRTEHHMHHKYAVFDGTSTLTGSYNWTRSANQFNDENLVVTDDARLARVFSDHFEKLWQKLAD